MIIKPKKNNKKVEEVKLVNIEVPAEEILPVIEEKISTKPRKKKTLLEMIEEEEN